MLPNLLSSTMNLADLLGNSGQGNSSKTQKSIEGTSEDKAGRPEKSNDEKSEKTI